MASSLRAWILSLALLGAGCVQDDATLDDCAGPDDPACSAAMEDLRIPGHYAPDGASLAAGSAIIPYDDVPAWDGGIHCSGGFTAGGRALSSYLRSHFSGISSVGGYSCRRNTGNTSRMSVHGSGRALDIMIPTDRGDADNGVGDRIANWLIAHSREIGVQYLIWDRTQWSASRSSGRVRAYTGPNPHIDHIHAEITEEASRLETPFFRSAPPVCTPSAETCNGRDDDCDGRSDEDLSRSCGSSVGVCATGTSTCEGGAWGACVGEIRASAETCDARDQDCDGRTDEDLIRTCGTDVGECVAGTETCGRGAWGACAGAIDPVAELCDALDNDCDGADDDERICEREEVAFSAAIVAWSETDVSGDGHADACARIDEQLACLVSDAHGFGRVLLGPTLTDDAGWSERLRNASLRMADLDGDGRSDVCGRDGDQFVCWRSDGSRFGDRIEGPAYGDDVTEAELADIDGDGLLDVCTRDGEGLHCHRGTGDAFAGVVHLGELSDADGFGDVIHHGSLRFGDVDGDGRADVCARSAEGVDCWRSEGDHFGRRVLGPRWADADGWDALPYWSTIRMADANGDGRDDVCARTPAGFRCALSTGEAFVDELAGPSMAGEVWDRVEVYATLRMGDLDGDGHADVCAREPTGVTCWLAGANAFDRVFSGPLLSDASGFAAPAHFRSIRLADVNGDGRDDLCAHVENALRCYLSEGYAFGDVWLAPAWSNTNGPFDDASLASIRIAGGGSAGASGALVGTFGCSAQPAARGISNIAGLVLLLALVLRRRKTKARGRRSA